MEEDLSAVSEAEHSRPLNIIDRETLPMADQYLLPCPQCGQEIEIAPPQAGSTITCTNCDHAFDGPRLGELKQLPLADSRTQRQGQTLPSQGSALKRVLFTVGLAMAVLLGAAGGGLYYFAGSIENSFDSQVQIQEATNQAATLTLEQIYLATRQMEIDPGLGEFKEPQFISNNRQASILKMFAWGLMALAAVGAAMMTTSFTIK